MEKENKMFKAEKKVISTRLSNDEISFLINLFMKQMSMEFQLWLQKCRRSNYE